MKIRWKQDRKSALEIKRSGDVVWLSYPVLERTGLVVQGFSTRLGGVSEGVCSSMNLSFSRGDKEEAVRENYRRIAGAMGFAVENIVTSDQTHTVNVRIVTEADRGKGITCPRDYTDIDGMITNVPGLVLATFYADCVPLYFVDPVHRAIGLCHSGWRGTVGKIGKETLKAMESAYHTRPDEVLAAIGPSICQDCYEVSEDVAELFAESFAKQYHRDLFYRKENGKYQLNLWKANERVLLDAGVQPENILLPGICTCCNPEFLFSHRASRGKRGNLAAFLGLYSQ
ncbi:MAG: peptidoglycan editing factor PgeF [Eubacteriales bacterium]|nr:peptidoglycan editing factor PgeF [Eubacteriales bacterium]